jgi:ubiquinone/menaquinone biosynthesis C-methylase UbiE
MKNLAPMTPHAALVEGGHDDRARQDFAFSLRNRVTSALMPATRTVFDGRARQRWTAAHGRDPQSPDDIRAAMDADPWYRFYLSVRRTSQELIWASVIPPIEAAGTPAPSPPAGGTLSLDPAVEVPAYVGAIDIHCMPGGYLADRGPAGAAGMNDGGDTAAGALYDRGVHLYMSGLMGPANDAVGRLAAAFLERRLPTFAPRRILDLGCGVGHATLPWAAAFPAAELHGIDIGPALLRYAHRRAESLGVPVHFRQANAEATGFPDGHFHLVASAILLHETSSRGLPAILAECRRLLAPGGVMLHVDQPRFDEEDAWATFLQENETHYNNEPFWRRYRRLDLAASARAAGFADVALETLSADVVQQSQNNGPGAASRSPGFLALLARA